MVHRRLVVAALALLVGMPGAARPQDGFSPEARAFIEEVDATLHSPWAEMEEFSADVTMSGLVLPGSTIRYLWRRDGPTRNPGSRAIATGCSNDAGSRPKPRS